MSLELDEKQILKKHVNTIHCSNNLTLIQRKLFNALLFNAYHDLSALSAYQISIKEICRLIGYESRDYKKLKKSILDLITTAIEWNVIDPENGDPEGKWRASAIISAANIEKGICTYEFSSLMRELLYSPEIYGKIDINVMTEFKSSYGLALYENCVRFQDIAQTQWLSIQVFRKLMGISNNHYRHFHDLKKRVLDIAVNEVNQYAPIKVVPEVQRVNKKVTAIRFKLLNNKAKARQQEKQQLIQLEQPLMQVLKKEFSLSEESINDIAHKYDKLYIQNKIHIIKQSDSFKLGKIRGLSAYLIDALKKDYQLTPGQPTLPCMQREKKPKVCTVKIDNAAEDNIRRLKDEKNRRVVKAYINKMSERDRHKLLKQFEKHIKEQDGFFLYKKYREKGMQSRIVQAVFTVFVKNLIDKESKLKQSSA